MQTDRSDTHGRAGRTRAFGLPAGERAAPSPAAGTACAMRQKSQAPFASAPPARAAAGRPCAAPARAAAGRAAPAAAAVAAARGRAAPACAAPWPGARAWPGCRAAPRVGLGTCAPARGRSLLSLHPNHGITLAHPLTKVFYSQVCSYCQIRTVPLAPLGAARQTLCKCVRRANLVTSMTSRGRHAPG